MIKPIGSKVFDRRIKQNGLEHDDSHSTNPITFTFQTLFAMVDQDESEYKRYIRRLSKLDIIDVIYSRLGHKIPEDYHSNGSTVKRHILEDLWNLIVKIDIDKLPRTKHKILEGIINHLGMKFDTETDTSASSTVTKYGVFKILVGIERKIQLAKSQNSES